jgi:DNA-binding GntR family transcriptional regulator
MTDDAALDTDNMREDAGVYERLHERFITGDFYPGDLINLPPLCAEYGVSRTPIREVLSRLAFEGLVKKELRGYRVAHRSPEEILDICESRMVLEVSLAEASAIKHSPLDIARITFLHDQIVALTSKAQTQNDIWDIRLLHNRWHYAIHSAGHNTTTSWLIEMLMSQLALSDAEARNDASIEQELRDLQLIVVEHKTIMDAIFSGDPQTARAEMSHHLSRARDDRLVKLAHYE